MPPQELFLNLIHDKSNKPLTEWHLAGNESSSTDESNSFFKKIRDRAVKEGTIWGWAVKGGYGSDGKLLVDKECIPLISVDDQKIREQGKGSLEGHWPWVVIMHDMNMANTIEVIFNRTLPASREEVEVTIEQKIGNRINNITFYDPQKVLPAQAKLLEKIQSEQETDSQIVKSQNLLLGSTAFYTQKKIFAQQLWIFFQNIYLTITAELELLERELGQLQDQKEYIDNGTVKTLSDNNDKRKQLNNNIKKHHEALDNHKKKLAFYKELRTNYSTRITELTQQITACHTMETLNSTFESITQYLREAIGDVEDAKQDACILERLNGVVSKIRDSIAIYPNMLDSTNISIVDVKTLINQFADIWSATLSLHHDAPPQSNSQYDSLFYSLLIIDDTTDSEAMQQSNSQEEEGQEKIVQEDKVVYGDNDFSILSTESLLPIEDHSITMIKEEVPSDNTVPNISTALNCNGSISSVVSNEDLIIDFSQNVINNDVFILNALYMLVHNLSNKKDWPVITKEATEKVNKIADELSKYLRNIHLVIAPNDTQGPIYKFKEDNITIGAIKDRFNGIITQHLEQDSPESKEIKKYIRKIFFISMKVIAGVLTLGTSLYITKLRTREWWGPLFFKPKAPTDQEEKILQQGLLQYVDSIFNPTTLQ